jgi:hypothetical protein
MGLYKIALYNKLLNKYKNKYRIEEHPSYKFKGEAIIEGPTPKIIIRDKQPHILAHELGHMENKSKPLQLLINAIGATGNFTGINWLTNKATRYKEMYANKAGLDILRQAGASEADMRKAQSDYSQYIDKYYK